MSKTAYPRARSVPGGLRYACHVAVGVLVVSLCLRTWFVQGLFLPVTVSGGSMAPTLLGPRRDVACRDCGFEFSCGFDRLPRGDLVGCPNCGFTGNRFDSGTDTAGEHVLVDRTAFFRRNPRRWDVVVFRCPQQAGQLCVKRIVGLPGETIEIRDGDVYSGGRIVRKSLPQQTAIAQLIHDADFAPGRQSDAQPRWRGDRSDSAWRLVEGQFHYEPPESTSDEQAGIDWLIYRHPGDQPVRDDYGYNQGESRRLHTVSDLMLSCRLSAAAGEVVRLAATDRSDRFEVKVHVGGRQIVLLRNAEIVHRVTCEQPVVLRSTTVHWSLFDRQVLLALDGEAVLAYAYQPTVPEQSQTPNPMSIGAAGGRLNVAELRLWRDIYYTRPTVAGTTWGLDTPARVASGAYYVLGDNSPISLDSRTLEDGAVSGNLFIGKPLGVR